MILRLMAVFWLVVGCSTTDNIQERCKELKSCASKCQSKCRERSQQCRKIEGGVGSVVDPDKPKSAKNCDAKYKECQETCKKTCDQPELKKECQRLENISDLLKPSE